MAKKVKPTDQQLSIPKLELENTDLDSTDDDWLLEDYGVEEPADRSSQPLKRELLTLKLLRGAIIAQNPDDVVMGDFAEYVLPNLLRVAIGVTAKGGAYFDELDRQAEIEGKEKVRRDRSEERRVGKEC